jgi:DNA-binding transcriptional regulator GbsR (MarR family)
VAVSEAAVVKRDQDEVGRFVERFAGLLADVGFPRMAARIFVTVLACDSGRMTAAELAESLQISPAAVSGAVRYLGSIDLIRREREPGSRRDFYRVQDDLWYEAITRRDQVLTRWKGSLREGVEVLGDRTPAGLRMAETLAFFEFTHEEMPLMMERWHKRRAQLHREWGVTD